MSIDEEGTIVNTQNSENNKLDAHAMMIVSKYFDLVNDYINLEKTDKEYNEIIDNFYFNPISFKNEKEREIFKNVETYHHYENEGTDDYKAKNDSRIKEHIHWEEVNYTTFKNKKDSEEYKNVVLKNIDIANQNNPDKPVKIDVNGYCGTLEGVNKISEGCFYNLRKLKTIELPSTLREIGDFSFKFSEISKIKIPEGVIRIGKSCFDDCSKLTKVELLSTVREIGDCAFKFCIELKSIKIPEGVTKFGKYCFSGCLELKSVILPSTLKEIGTDAFLSCFNLKTIIAPKSVIDLLRRSNNLPKDVEIIASQR